MKVEYTGAHSAVETPDGQVFEQGKPVDVADALGAALIRQGNFKEVKAGK